MRSKISHIEFYVRFMWLLCFYLSAQLLQGQNHNNDTLSENGISKSFQSIIQTLAHDSMGGRYAGSVYEIKTLEFFKQHLSNFVDNDYNIKTDTFTYCCRNDSNVTAHNFWVWPKQSSKKIIILAAHYDHLPPNSIYSKEIWHKNEIHPGADDNASGVGMAISLFKHFYLKKQDFDVALVLFSGHEEGLHGSKYWLEKHANTSDSIILMLNFDMVGRFSEETHIVSIRTDENNIYKTQLQEAASQSNIKLNINTESFIDTDSFIFFKHNIPSLTVSTGIHNDYHRTSDTPDKINYKGMLTIFNFLMDFINKF